MINAHSFGRRSRRAAITTVLVILGAACGSADDGITGDFRHPTEELVSLSDDGTGFVDQSTATAQLDRTALNWAVDGESVTITFENGNSTIATISDGDLVFAPDIWSCCDDTEAIFASCTDCQVPPGSAGESTDSEE